MQRVRALMKMKMIHVVFERHSKTKDYTTCPFRESWFHIVLQPYPMGLGFKTMD